MTDRLISSDVFYDQGNGEFQVLSSDLIAELDHKIETALGSTTAIAYDTYQLGNTTDVAIGSFDSMTMIENALGELVPIETALTVMRMNRQIDAVEKILAIMITEKATISQMAMSHDYEELHTLTEQYITAPLREKYIIYRYADGSYEASVEQHDLLDEKAAITTRPMTLYDAGEVLAQIDGAVQRSGM